MGRAKVVLVSQQRSTAPACRRKAAGHLPGDLREDVMLPGIELMPFWQLPSEGR